MDYTTPPHSRAPTEAAEAGQPHHVTPIQTGSSSHYEMTSGAPRARVAYNAATPVTMRGEYGEAAHMLGMTNAGVDVGHAAVASPVVGGPVEGGAVGEKTAEAAARAHGGPTPNFDFGGAIGSLSGGDEKKKLLSQPPAVNASQVGRSLVWKVGKGVKRGDLPFMLVFIACVSFCGIRVGAVLPSMNDAWRGASGSGRLAGLRRADCWRALPGRSRREAGSVLILQAVSSSFFQPSLASATSTPTRSPPRSPGRTRPSFSRASPSRPS